MNFIALKMLLGDRIRDVGLLLGITFTSFLVTFAASYFGGMSQKNIKTPLTFVRFEPYVVPKKSLTGDSTERVDTRVLQVIFNFKHDDLPIFVGQQMDVFIDAPER